MWDASRAAIRLAAGDELDAVRSFYETQGYGGGALFGDRIIVAEIDRAIVGVVRLTREDNVWVLRGMHVEPSRQRQGLGTRMLHAVEPLIPVGEECWCLPHGHLAGLYARIGFEDASVTSAPAFLRERYIVSQAKWGDIIAMRRPPDQDSGPR